MEMTHAAFTESRYSGKLYGVENQTALPIAYEMAAAEQVYRAMLAAAPPAPAPAPAAAPADGCRSSQPTDRRPDFACTDTVCTLLGQCRVGHKATAAAPADGPSDHAIRQAVDMCWHATDAGHEYVTLSPEEFGRAVRRAIHAFSGAAAPAEGARAQRTISDTVKRYCCRGAAAEVGHSNDCQSRAAPGEAPDGKA